LQALNYKQNLYLKYLLKRWFFLIETLLWGTEIIKCKGSQTKKHIC
jgi:hypothetical protein